MTSPVIYAVTQKLFQFKKVASAISFFFLFPAISLKLFINTLRVFHASYVLSLDECSSH